MWPVYHDGKELTADSDCIECGIPYNRPSPGCPHRIFDRHPRAIVNPSPDKWHDAVRMAETCPVCGSLFLPAALAAHVDNHLRRDTIELRIGGSKPGLYIGGYRIRASP